VPLPLLYLTQKKKVIKITSIMLVRDLNLTSINQIIKLSLLSNHKEILINKTVDRPTLFDGSESWIIRRYDQKTK
jgi:hypothetical protein